MAALVDTNVLVYRFDPRFPEKQRIATELRRRGIAEDSIRVPHQAIVEFVAVVTRPLGGEPSLLTAAEARREAKELLAQFEVVYPTKLSCEPRCGAQRPTGCPGSTRTFGPTRSITVSASCTRKTSSTIDSTARCAS